MGRAAMRWSARGPEQPAPRGDTAGSPAHPVVVGLGSAEASDAVVAGGKAAALGRAARAGLPVLPGVVVPVGTPVEELTGRSPLVASIRAELGPGPLIVRSSSPWEDTEERSMAGRFATVPSVVGDAALAEAIREVVRSGARVAAEEGREEPAPVAVLVQPMARGAGGVCFGVEPVSGRADRVLAVVAGEGPEAVATGRVEGVRHLLAPDGRLLRRDGDADPAGRLDAARCRALAALVARAGELFGEPQDVEFLFEPDGTLRLLQARPVTTPVRGAPVGPVYGSGPVAETFPDPLRPLEVDLWVDPLRDGLREALALSALAGRRQLRRRPLVVVVEGRVAVDLDVIGDTGRRRWARLDLGRRARRARAAWRVGRLRGALPALARDVVVRADALLDEVGPLDPLTDRQLVGLLDRCRDLLRSLHGHEVLMGFLVPGTGGRLTGVSVAMRTLVAGRADGLPDPVIVARSPVVLALTGPRVGPVQLPRHVDLAAPPLPDGPDRVDEEEAALLREALRLRVRWVQELGARAAEVLGRRLATRGALRRPDEVAALRFEELAATVAGGSGSVVLDLRERAVPAAGAPLPARFRLDTEGRPVPVDVAAGDGVGAGGGRGRGPVVHDPHDADPGSVLVVRQLSPELAWVLPRLGGLVAETGSPLAHLAILAREASVPVVVASPGATTRFDVGQVVEVDGGTGAVTAVGAGRGSP